MLDREKCGEAVLSPFSEGRNHTPEAKAAFGWIAHTPRTDGVPAVPHPVGGAAHAPRTDGVPAAPTRTPGSNDFTRAIRSERPSPTGPDRISQPETTCEYLTSDLSALSDQ